MVTYLLTVATVVFVTLPHQVLSMNNGIGRTPLKGWMSWMYYTEDINEQIIKGVVDEMVNAGYRDAGYQYVCIGE